MNATCKQDGCPNASFAASLCFQHYRPDYTKRLGANLVDNHPDLWRMFKDGEITMAEAIAKAERTFA